MNPNQKRIALATIVISTLALIIEILPLITVPSWISRTYPVLYYFGNVVNVQFLNNAIGEVHSRSPLGNTDYFELFFYVLMLLGGILYWVSRYREVRLIRFTYAIIGATAAIGVLSTIIAVAMYYKEYMAQNGSFVWMLYAFPKAILLIYLSMWVLKKIEKTRSLHTYIDAAGEEILTSTPKIQRFFHHITDTILSILVCTPLLLPLLIDFLRKVEDAVGERTAIFTMVVLCRFLYYVLFESVLGASPAKLFTGSRVVTFSGQRPDVYKILWRSVCRNIPFEPFSFFGRSGWHDTISETDVVKEKNDGAPAARYLWIVPATVVIGLVSYFGYDAYKDYQYHKREQAAFDAKVKLWMHELDHPSPSLYILLEEESTYPYRGTYLKVDSVMGDKWKVRVLTVGSEDMSQISIASSFDDQSTTEEATINLADLRGAITTDYNERYGKKSLRKILSDMPELNVKNIFVKNEPAFSDGGGSLSQSQISLGLKNCGWPVEIVEAKSIEGNLQWAGPLPMSLEGATGTGYSPCSETYLDFTPDGNPYADYIVELVVKTSDGNRLVFVLKGAGLTASIERKIE